MNGKNVLVTGGAGFIGSNLILALLERGANVRATIHWTMPQIRGFDHPEIDYLIADLENKEDCQRACEDMDYVFLCAANTSGAAVMDATPLVHVTPNVIMNARMLEAAHEAHVEKLLFISSNTVYPLTDHPVKESDMKYELFEKYFSVGWMKIFTEIMCEMYASKIKNPMKTLVVRPGNLYGEYDDFEWETSHVVSALIKKAVERHDPIEVWGDGKDIKDLIYVKDFVEGMLLVMEKQNNFDPINIASGQPCSVLDVLNTILKAANYGDANIKFNADKPTMIPKRLIDISKAKKLGFNPKFSLDQGISNTVKWYEDSLTKISESHK